MCCVSILFGLVVSAFSQIMVSFLLLGKLNVGLAGQGSTLMELLTYETVEAAVEKRVEKKEEDDRGWSCILVSP